MNQSKTLFGAFWISVAFVVTLTQVGHVHASGPIAVYAAIEKVIMEPNEQTPERIQIWGAFSFVNGGINKGQTASPPQRGYIYMSVFSGSTPSERDAIRKEWMDLQTVAGTGQVVAFGDWGFVPGGILVPRRSGVVPVVPAELRVLTEVPLRAAPVPYLVNIGVVKVAPSVNNSRILEQLKALVKKRN